jgi:hypothetical protein
MDFSPDGGGAGNLADELDQLDDEEELDDEVTEMAVEDGDGERLPSPVDGARDSGIDVSYSSKRGSPHVRNFSKPFGLGKGSGIAERASHEEGEEQEDLLSPELEEAMNSIARMAAYAGTSEDPLIPRVLGLLQDLGNQSNLEAGVQRLLTSTNSMTSNLGVQSKSLQALMTALYSPLAIFYTPLDPIVLEETVPLIEVLLKDLPLPDPAPLQGVQKLDRETANVIQTLSQLTDTLQMGKHTMNNASRHLRTTQTMVVELRRERERAEAARRDLSKSDWNSKIKDRWCAGECRDIMGGFESLCDSLRQNLIEAGGAAA